MVTEMKLRGTGVTCNICGRSYTSFLPSSHPPIPNSCCPNCFSFARTRLPWLYLNKNTDLLTRPIKVLHFAPEIVIYKQFKNKSAVNYTPCDYFSEGYDYPEDCVNIDITNIPFENESFDLILCAHVLEHVPDDGKAMSELYRVLKPGGAAILQVPMADAEET